MSVALMYFVAGIYILVAVNEWWTGHNGMSLAFFAYALANIGLAIETLR